MSYGIVPNIGIGHARFRKRSVVTRGSMRKIETNADNDQQWGECLRCTAISLASREKDSTSLTASCITTLIPAAAPCVVGV